MQSQEPKSKFPLYWKRSRNCNCWDVHVCVCT